MSRPKYLLAIAILIAAGIGFIFGVTSDPHPPQLTALDYEARHDGIRYHAFEIEGAWCVLAWPAAPHWWVAQGYDSSWRGKAGSWQVCRATLGEAATDVLEQVGHRVPRRGFYSGQRFDR